MKNLFGLSFLVWMTCCSGVVSAEEHLDYLHVEQSYEWDGELIKLQLGYPEAAEIRVWDNAAIKVLAKVKMINTNDTDISQDFQWQKDKSDKQITITANFGEQIGNTVVLASGSDVNSGIPDNTTVSSTKIVVYIPSTSQLDVNSLSGTLNITHPDNSLLVNAISNVTVKLAENQGVSASINTMMGEIHVANEIKVSNIGNDSDKYQALNKRQKMFHLNGGGVETSIITAVGNIRFEIEND